jgi:hypothetical protein
MDNVRRQDCGTTAGRLDDGGPWQQVADGGRFVDDGGMWTMAG